MVYYSFLFTPYPLRGLILVYRILNPFRGAVGAAIL